MLSASKTSDTAQTRASRGMSAPIDCKVLAVSQTFVLDHLHDGHLKRAGARLVLEIGTVFGGSARDFADRGATVLCLSEWPATVLGLTQQPLQLEGLTNQADWVWTTFLASTPDYRSQIVPIRKKPADAIPELAQAGFQPEQVFIEGGRSYADVRRELALCHSHFPAARLTGRVTNYGQALRAVGDFCRESLGRKPVLQGFYWSLDTDVPREDRPQPLIVSVHIPKTGGTSFARVLEQAVPRLDVSTGTSDQDSSPVVTPGCYP